MSLRDFGLATQVVVNEYGRLREAKQIAEEENKRRMYALERRHASGEHLRPSELYFLLSMQDKYDRPPAIPDPDVVPLTLEQLKESSAPFSSSQHVYRFEMSLAAAFLYLVLTVALCFGAAFILDIPAEISDPNDSARLGGAVLIVTTLITVTVYSQHIVRTERTER